MDGRLGDTVLSRLSGAGEGGFTVVEVLVAAIVLVLGSLAVLMTFASAIHNVQRSREQQIGISVAQREMERVRVIPYASVALEPLPTRVADAASPRSRLKLNGSVTEYDLKRPATIPEWRPVMSSEAGQVAPESTGIKASDGTKVTVFRYVACEEEEVVTNATCLAKRIVIDIVPVAKADLAKYKHAYYELQSTLVSPSPPKSP